MLTEIRDRSSGAFAWVIAALIIIPMAFWGVQEYASTEANPSLVEFGDQKITQSEFQSSLNNEQQRMRSRMGDNANDAFLNSDGFKQNVLQRLVNRALLKQVATDENYRVSNEQLAKEIRESELFQLDGKFNQEAYERFLISSQYAKRQYEDALRDDLVLQQVTTGYEESAIVLPGEIRALLEAQAERRSFDVAILRKQGFIEGITVEDAEINEYYTANQANFMDPQKVSIQYLELNQDEIAESIEVSEEDLRANFEENQESFQSAARRETRHILLSTTTDNEAEQLTKAEDLVKQLREGADFAELAKTHSEDPGSAQNGGSLGLVEPGQMVPEFEQATFALAKDEISDPVKSPFGYHIIQVLDIQAPQQQDFEEVRFDLLQAARDEQAEQILLERVDQLRDFAFEQPDTLEEAAEELQLELRETELFDQSQGDGIAALPAVRNAAFSEEVLIEGLNSEPIEVAAGQVIVLRKLSEQEAAPKPLESVKDTIRSTLENEKAAQAAADRGDELLTAAKTNWESLNDSESLEMASHNVSLVDPNRAVAPQVLERVSQMQLSGGSAKVDSVVDRNGDVHIVRLREITPGNADTVSEQIKDATRRVLAQRNGGALLNAYLEELREEKAPNVNADLL